MPAAFHQQPHLAEGFGIYQRLVGSLHHNPVFSGLFQTLLGFVTDLHHASLNHISDIGFILQHFRDSLTAPQAGVGAAPSHTPSAVSCRGRYALLIESGGDFSAAHPIQRHGEDPPHDGCHFLVNDDLVLLRGVHLVAIHGLATDELPPALLIPFDGLDLLGNVLGIHVVHNRPEGGDVIGSGFHAGVDAVQQGNVTHTLFREVPLHVVTGHDVVAAQTGQVLGDDHIDLFGFNVRKHPPECRAVKGGSAVAVIDIGVVYGEPMLFYKFIQQRVLVGNALGRTFAFILPG